MAHTMRPQTAIRRNRSPALDDSTQDPLSPHSAATGLPARTPSSASKINRVSSNNSSIDSISRPRSAVQAPTALRTATASRRVSSASRLRSQAEAERTNDTASIATAGTLSRPPSGLSRPPTGMSRASKSSRLPSPVPGSDPGEIARISGNLWLGQLLTLMRSINKWPTSLDPGTTCRALRLKAAALVQAESAAVFLVDEANCQVVLQSSNSAYCADKASRADEIIHVPFGKGIVGTVASTGETVVSSKVQDERTYDGQFDNHASVNGSADVPPTSMLCVPWLDPGGEMIAIIQVVNKKCGLPFSSEDEVMLQLLGMKASTVLRCCDLHLRMLRDMEEKSFNADVDRRLPRALKVLLESTAEDDDDIMILSVAQIEELFHADFCSVFRLDDTGETLWSIAPHEDDDTPPAERDRVELAVSVETTSGYSIVHKTALNVPNIYLDDRFNSSIAASGLARSDNRKNATSAEKCGICCVPILLPSDRVESIDKEDSQECDGVLDAGSESRSPGSPVSIGSEGVAPPDTPSEEMRVIGVVEVIRRNHLAKMELDVLVDYCKTLAKKFAGVDASRKRQQTLRYCSEISASVGSEQAIRRAEQALRVCMGTKDVKIMLRDADSGSLAVKTAMGGSVHVAPTGLCGYVLRTKRTLNLVDARGAALSDGTQLNPSLDAVGSSEVVSFLCVPIMAMGEGGVDGELHGVAFAANKRREGDSGILRFVKEDEEHAGMIIRHLAETMEREETHAGEGRFKDGYEKILRAAPQLFSEFDVRRLLRIICDDVCNILGAEHCTPYIVDETSDEIWTKIEGFRREVRLPRRQGIVGGVAISGKLVTIHDAEEAKQVLGETSDKLTGGVVSSMLCCGVAGSKGTIIAVLQAFHSKPKVFSSEHEELIQLYSRLAAVAFENQALMVQKHVNVFQGIPVEWEREKVHRALSNGVKHQLDCEKAVIYEIVSPWDRLTAVARGRANKGKMIDFPAGKGIVGSVFSSGNAVMTQYPQHIPLFDPAIDQPTKKGVRSLLCVPMHNESSVCMGAILALNKRRGVFARQDEVTLKALCSQFGEILSSRHKLSVAKDTTTLQSFFLRANEGLSGLTELRAIIKTVNQFAQELLSWHACTIFEYDRVNERLFTFDAEGGPLRIPLSQTTVAGYTCQTGELLRIEDVYQDSRFNKYYSRNKQQEKANMLCCPVKRNADVLAIIQCVRNDGESFSLIEETKMRDFAQQVVMPAFHSFYQNRPAYRIFSLVDDFCTISAEVQSKNVLTYNIKQVVRKALVCEKVNVFTVDGMRQELVSNIASSFQDEIEFLEEEIISIKSRLKVDATDKKDDTIQDSLSKLKEDYTIRLNQATQQRDRMAGSISRFPFGRGIVGKVAETGGFYNSQDVSKEVLVDCEQFSILGKVTRNMLCHCAYNTTGDMVGVIQAINKNHGVFTQEDEFLLERFAGQAGVMLFHHETLSRLDKSSKARRKFCEFAVQVIQCIDDISVIEMMQERGSELLGTRKCTLWVHDSLTSSMWTLDDKKQIKSVQIRELSTSVVGMTAISCEAEIQVFDTDDSGDPAAEKTEGEGAPDEKMAASSKVFAEGTFRSCTMGQPVLGKKKEALPLALTDTPSRTHGELLGVIECTNKRGGVFDEEDKYVMEVLAAITAGVLQTLPDARRNIGSMHGSKRELRRMSVI